jgi:hypothetical protein
MAAFVKGIDFTDFAPVACDAPGLMGAMLGNDHQLIGWFRDARCVPPQWELRDVSRRGVILGVHPGTWQVEFVDTTTGRLITTSKVKAKKSQMKIPLPTFQGSIALRLTASIAGGGARGKELFPPADQHELRLARAREQVNIRRDQK